MNTAIYITAIKNLLSNFVQWAHNTNLRNDSNWTYEIKSRLALLGKEYDYCTATGGFGGEFDGEWLYDLVWYKEEGEGENKKLISVPLVVESEWNLRFDHIKGDFEKLLLANAALRLMICQASEENKTHRIEYFKTAVTSYQLCKPGDTFLIALLDYDTEQFYFEEIVK